MTRKVNRRNAMKGAGALVFAFTGAGDAVVSVISQAQAQGTAAPRIVGPDPEMLDTWIRLAKNGRFTVFTGKVDHGQGLETAFAQIVADELDVRVDHVSIVMGQTDNTPNQGGASGSTGIRMGANPLRNTAAEVRRLLLEAAAQKLGAPADQLMVSDGVVSVKGQPKSRVAYADLFGGKQLDAKVEWNRLVA